MIIISYVQLFRTQIFLALCCIIKLIERKNCMKQEAGGQLTLDQFRNVKEALNKALNDLTNPDINAINKIAKENPDAWPVAAKRIVDVIGKQINKKVSEGASVEEEYEVRNWAAQFLQAIGIPIARRLTIEELQRRRESEEIQSKPIKGETKFPSYEAYVQWVNDNAETFTPEDAMEILKVVYYQGGGFIPVELTEIWERRVIAQEEMPLVKQYLKSPNLGEFL